MVDNEDGGAPYTATSTQLDLASISTRKWYPMYGPAWAICTRCKLPSGSSHGWRGAFGELNATDAH